LLQVLRQAGVCAGSTVILYGRNTLAAARVAQLMLVAGVQDVRLLDGGLAAWCAAGHALQQGPERVPFALDHGVNRDPAAHVHPGGVQSERFVPRPDYLIDTAQAKALRLQNDGALVSIRSRAEHLGEMSGYSYIDARGDIAGALWGHAGVDGDVNSMGSFQDALGRMKPAADIAALWREAGIGPEMQIAFYCGTGWRASLAFFYAWLMGWPRISVYDGGWFEWSSDPANPLMCRTAL
jgi:thiosulfate/3-mercaptopyruvate sulfurtransferase